MRNFETAKQRGINQAIKDGIADDSIRDLLEWAWTDGSIQTALMLAGRKPVVHFQVIGENKNPPEDRATLGSDLSAGGSVGESGT